MTRRRTLLLLLPATLLFFIFFVIPQMQFLRISFEHNLGYGRTSSGPTTENFEYVLTDPFMVAAIWKTLRLGLIVTVVTIVLAYPVATMIVRTTHPLLSRLIFIAVVSSMFMSAVSRGLGMNVMLANNGPVNRILEGLHLIDEPLQLSGNITGVTIGMVQLMVPFAVLTSVSVVEGVPASLLRAAYGLGASRARVFWTVVFPLTARPMVPISLLVFALTAGAYATPAVLGGGRVNLLAIRIREQTLTVLNYPRGAAIAAVLLVIVLLIVAIGMRLGREGDKVAPRGKV